MTNAEKIRNMSTEELNEFLWWFKINSVAIFLQKGGEGTMDAEEQKEWLDSDAPWQGTEFMQPEEEECIKH